MAKDEGIENEGLQEDESLNDDSVEQDTDAFVDDVTDFLKDDDDYQMLSDDVVLASDDDSALVKQLAHEEAIQWAIHGMYSDKGKTHPSLFYRDNPPILNIYYPKTGEETNVILTKELTRTLSKTFQDLNKAYHGAGRTRGEKSSLDESVKNLPDWIRKNKVQSGFLAFAVIFFIYVLFFL